MFQEYISSTINFFINQTSNDYSILNKIIFTCSIVLNSILFGANNFQDIHRFTVYFITMVYDCWSNVQQCSDNKDQDEGHLGTQSNLLSTSVHNLYKFTTTLNGTQKADLISHISLLSSASCCFLV